MTAALTSVGIQQVSITIPSGQTTSSVSINTVGAGAFLVWQGFNAANAAAQVDDSNAYLTFTTSSVTATRGVSSANTVTVNGAVIDGDTTNLIKSVQSGTIVVSSTNTSATINPSSTVTVASSAIFYLGDDSANTLATLAAGITRLSFTTSSITVNRITGTTAVVTTGYCLVQFQSSALNSATQSLAFSDNTAGTSSTSSITAITSSNAMLAYGGQNPPGSNPAAGQMYATLGTSSVTFTWNTSVSAQRNYNCTVIEFVSSVLAASVQRGTMALSAASSVTSSITSSPTAATLCNWLFNSTTQTTVDFAVSAYEISQATASSITMTAHSAATGTGSFEVIQFNAAGTLLTFDNGLPSEILANDQIKKNCPFDARGTIVPSKGFPDEFLANLSTADGSPFEFTAKYSTTDLSSYEFKGGLLIGRNMPYEFTATTHILTSDIGLPFEFVAALTIPKYSPYESIGGFQAGKGILEEFTAQSLSQRLLPDEALDRWVAGRMMPLESLSTQLSTKSIPFENLGGFTGIRYLPDEITAGQSRGIQLPDESLGSGSRANMFPDEAIGRVAPVKGMPFENTGSIVVTADDLLPFEILARIQPARNVQDEAMGGFLLQKLTPYDALALASINSRLYDEFLGGFQNPKGLPLEYKGNAQLIKSLPLESKASLSDSTVLAVENLANQIRASGLPVEWLAQQRRMAIAALEIVAGIIKAGSLPYEILVVSTMFTTGKQLPFEFAGSISPAKGLCFEFVKGVTVVKIGAVLLTGSIFYKLAIADAALFTVTVKSTLLKYNLSNSDKALFNISMTDTLYNNVLMVDV